MLPIFFAILVSIILAQVESLAEGRGVGSLFSFYDYSEMLSLSDLLVIAAATATILLLFFCILRIREKFAAKILVATFIAGGMLSILLFGRIIFILMGSESQLLLLVFAVIAFVGMYFAFLVFVDAVSNKTRNKLFVISSGAFGAFLGVLIPALPLIGISIALAIADTILILSDTVQRMLGEVKYKEWITQLTFSTQEWGIGIGDLICYSIIVSNTSINFGVLAGSVCIALILIGSFLTMKLAVRYMRVPGLPIVTALSLLPSITLLIS